MHADNKTPCDLLTPDLHVRGSSSSLRPGTLRGYSRKSCVKRGSSCCCHRKGTIGRRFWAFKYTPLSMVIGNCGNPRYYGRQYLYSFRVALSQLGFPWAVTAAIGIQSEASGFCIGISLRPQQVVRYTSPGFEILYSLKWSSTTLDEAVSSFTEMYRKDPSFIHQINPAGQGYIEVY